MRDPFWPGCYDEDEYDSEEAAQTEALKDYLTGVFEPQQPSLIEDLAAGRSDAVADLVALDRVCQALSTKVEHLACLLVEEATNLATSGLLQDAARRLECFTNPKYPDMRESKIAWHRAMADHHGAAADHLCAERDAPRDAMDV